MSRVTRQPVSSLMDTSVHELEEFLRGNTPNNLCILAEAAEQQSRAKASESPFQTEPPLLAEPPFSQDSTVL